MSRDNTDIKKREDKDEHAVFCVILDLGPWKNKVHEKQRNIILTAALNHCLKTNHLKVSVLGYLITRRRIFIIFESKRGHFNEIMKVFKMSLAKNIVHFLNRLEYSDLLESYDNERAQRLLGELFTQRPLYNDTVMRLITGREPFITYYSPHIAKLKDRIKNYDFCSAHDYTGAEGPVKVTIKSHSFWDLRLKKIKKPNPKYTQYLVK